LSFALINETLARNAFTQANNISNNGGGGGHG
jgi:hypothetical protein